MAELSLAEQGAELRSLGAEIDAGNDPDTSHLGDEPQESQPETAEEPTPKPEPEAKVKAPAEPENKSESESADPSPEKKDAKAADTKEPSRYQKERERQAEAWKKIEAEKEAVRKERAEIEAARKPKEQAFKDQDGYTAQDYRNAAQKAFDDMQQAKADLDDDKAKEAEGYVLHFQQMEQQARQAEHQAARRAAADFAVNQFPELKDPKNPLRIEADKIRAEYPILDQHPDGLKIAPVLAKYRMQAGEVPALKKQIEELTKEKARLEGLTVIGGSGPTKRPSEDANPNRALTEKDLRRMAAEHDAQVGHL